MIEKKLLELYIRLDFFSNHGWVPMKSDDLKGFYVLSPSKELYSSTFPNNPFNKKDNLTKEEEIAKDYLETLIEYEELIEFFPKNIPYTLIVEKDKFFKNYKLVKHSKEDIQ